MGMATLPAPIDVAGGALAEELMQRKARERAEMRVGQMREREHSLSACPSGSPVVKLAACVDAASLTSASVGGAGQLGHDARVRERESGLPDIGGLGPETSDDEREKHDDNPSGEAAVSAPFVARL